jgi:hypothetical protein
MKKQAADIGSTLYIISMSFIMMIGPLIGKKRKFETFKILIIIYPIKQNLLF